MEDPFMMYHRTKAPYGQIFRSVPPTREELANAGWVDCPSKIGVNIWGPSAEGAVAKNSAAFAAGALPAIDKSGFVEEEEQAQLEAKLQAEKDRDRDMRGDEDVYKKMREGQQRRQEAYKGGEKHPQGTKHEVPPLKRPAKRKPGPAVKATRKPAPRRGRVGEGRDASKTPEPIPVGEEETLRL